MFTPITATSFAQHEQLDAMIAEAQAEGRTVDGLLTDNPGATLARFVLVFDDDPARGSEYDRIFTFEGEEIARAAEAVSYKVEQFISQLQQELDGPLDLVA